MALCFKGLANTKNIPFILTRFNLSSRPLFRLIITAGTKKAEYPTDIQSRQGCSYVSLYFLVVAEISGDERGGGGEWGGDCLLRGFKVTS